MQTFLDNDGLIIKSDNTEVVIATNKITINKENGQVVCFERLYGMPFVSYDGGENYIPLFETWENINKIASEYISENIK